MTNYKTEQEKQDEEFEKYFVWVLASGLHEVHLLKPIKDYFLNRDQALLEAFKKDVGKMKKDAKWFEESYFTAEKAYPSFNKIYDQALDDILSLLKDYKLNMKQEIEKCCEDYNGTVDMTNSCIFCKTYHKNT